MDFYRIESCRGEEGRPEGEAPFWNLNAAEQQSGLQPIPGCCHLSSLQVGRGR